MPSAHLERGAAKRHAAGAYLDEARVSDPLPDTPPDDLPPAPMCPDCRKGMRLVGMFGKDNTVISFLCKTPVCHDSLGIL
jgi:hypothetical protein